MNKWFYFKKYYHDIYIYIYIYKHILYTYTHIYINTYIYLHLLYVASICKKKKKKYNTIRLLIKKDMMQFIPFLEYVVILYIYKFLIQNR